MALAVTFPTPAQTAARRPIGEGTEDNPYRLDAFRIPDGRWAFTWPDTGTTMVLCDGSWDCPRRHAPEHSVDFLDVVTAPAPSASGA